MNESGMSEAGLINLLQNQRKIFDKDYLSALDDDQKLIESIDPYDLENPVVIASTLDKACELIEKIAYHHNINDEIFLDRLPNNISEWGKGMNSDQLFFHSSVFSKECWETLSPRDQSFICIMTGKDPDLDKMASAMKTDGMSSKGDIEYVDIGNERSTTGLSFIAILVLFFLLAMVIFYL